MIPKVLGLFLYISWLQGVYGAAYSQVYVQNGAEVVPVEYVKYGAPRVVTNRQIAALSAPPIGSAVPLPNVVSSCVAPCVVPSQNIGSFAPVPNAKIVYNAPSAPAVVVSTNDEKSSYEYSYVVYDEGTGDRKAQRELSDGSVVHGEYSFVQPDGYVREVKYTADDLTGFNAVVKSFLPQSVLGVEKKKPDTNENSEPPPCKETKSEALKIKQPKPESSETQKPASEPPQVEAYVELSVVPVYHAPADYVSEKAVPPVPDNVISQNDEHAEENAPKNIPDHANETPEEHAKHIPHQAEITNPKEPVSEPVRKIPAVELVQTPTKDDFDQKTHAAEQAPSPQVSFPNGLPTYSDILRCIQAAMANKDAKAPSISPLTYIILPAANKPC